MLRQELKTNDKKLTKKQRRKNNQTKVVREGITLASRKLNAFYMLYLTDRDKKMINFEAVNKNNKEHFDTQILQYIQYAPFPSNLPVKATNMFYLDERILAEIVTNYLMTYEQEKDLIRTYSYNVEDFFFPNFVVDPILKLLTFYFYLKALKNPTFYTYEQFDREYNKQFINSIKFKQHVYGTSDRLFAEVCCARSMIKTLSIPLQLTKGSSCFYKKQATTQYMHSVITKIVEKFSINDDHLTPDLVSICYITDETMIFLQPHIFYKIYFMRRKFKHNESYFGPGKAISEQALIAQSEQPSFIKSVFKTSKDIITEAFCNVFNSINQFFKNMGIRLGSLVEWFREKIMDLKEICYSFFERAIKFSLMNTDKISMIIHAICWATSLIMLGIAGFITWNTVRMMMRARDMDIELPEAQGQSVPWLIMTLSSILGVTISERSFSYQVISKIMKVIAFGGTALTAGAVLIKIMPLSIRLFLIENFGTDEQKMNLVVEDWVVSVSRAQSISYEAQVFRSLKYRRFVVRLHKLGLKLMLDVKHYPNLAKLVLPWFQKLSKLYKTVKMYESTRVKRDEPFGIHISATAGVGKSLILESLIRDLAGYEPYDIYTKGVNTEFTIGYMGEPVYVMDEFLVGNEETKQRDGLDYLHLKSSAQYRPNMPSIDDPISGIKGTIIFPKFVITMNNTKYDRVQSLDDFAIQRRRDVNIEFARVTGEKKAVPIHELTEEELKDKSFIICRLIPPTHQADLSEFKWVSYHEMIELVRAKLDTFRQTSERVRTAFNLGPSPEIDVDRMVDEAVDDTYNVSKPVNIFDKISGIFSYTAESQGDNENENEDTDDLAIKIEEEMVRTGMESDNSSISTEMMIIDEDYNFDDLDEEMKEVLRSKNVVDEIGELVVDEDLHMTRLGRNLEVIRQSNGKINSYVKYLSKCKKIHFSEIEMMIIKRGICTVAASKNDIVESILNKINAAGLSTKLLELYGETIGHSTDEFMYEEITKVEYLEDLTKRILMSISPYNDNEKFLCYVDLGKDQVLIKKSSSYMIPVCLGVGAAIFMGANYFLGTFNNEITAETEKPKINSTRAKRPQKLERIGNTVANSLDDPSQKMKLLFEGGSIDFKAIGVGGRVFLTFSHILRQKARLKGFQIVIGDEILECDYNEQNIVQVKDGDVMFFLFDNNKLAQNKKIVSRFVEEYQSQQVDTGKVYLPLKRGHQHGNIRRDKSIRYTVSSNNSSIELKDPFVYNVNTAIGDCGSPVISSEGIHASKILGIHVAGYSNIFSCSQGYASPVYKETVEQAIELLESAPIAQSNDANISSKFLNKEDCYPNLFYAAKNARRVHVSTKTKLKKSIFYGNVGVGTDKSPAILISNDPRANGHNPIEKALTKIFKAEKKELDREKLLRCTNSLKYKFKQVLYFPIRRELTIEEAVGGIPGLLSSLNLRTSPGYPLMAFVNKKLGKQDYVRFEGDDLIIDEELKKLVMIRITEMEKGEKPRNYFVAFLKDELRSQQKIDDVATRITFANDMVSLIAFRMKFGGFIIAINNSFLKTGIAIGLNQYSRDMHKIYEYLGGPEGRIYFDGDFAGFDLSMPKQLLESAYSIVGDLCVDMLQSDENSVEYFIRHELEGKVMMGDLIFKCIMNFSGCWLTTPINCIVVQLAFRYVFIEWYPHLDFDDHLKLVETGDDHLVSIEPSFGITPQMLAIGFEKIGLNYTCADKSPIDEAKFKNFDEVTFLGARPVFFSERDETYIGLCKITSILDSLQYTRNLNLTIKQEATTKLELLSFYEEKFYNHILAHIKQVFINNNIEFEWTITYEQLRLKVAARSTIQQATAQSEVPELTNMSSQQLITPTSTSTDLPVNQTPVTGLTTLTTNKPQVATKYEPSVVQNNAHRSINEEAMDISFGLDSMVKRTTIEWSTTDNQGDTLASINLPWDLLALGNVNNIQNMPFNNFIYFVGDIEITFQVNGVPTQAGMVVASHVPFYNGTAYYDEWTSFNHVLLTPADNACKNLIIPFKFWRNAMNTYAGPLGEETLGVLNMGVLVPLASLTASTCAITIYSRFINVKFSIPRPLAPVAQGNTSSNITYNMGNIAGNVPVETQVDASHNVNGSLTMPMDNPPITGCSLPFAGIYPSMSKNKGLEPTVSMQHHPEMMNREAHALTDPLVSDINNILSRRFLWNSVNWTSTMVTGDVLYNVPLNTVLLDDADVVYDTPCSLALALLSDFSRWRADFVFEVYVNRTAFHSGRLLATTAYGAPSIDSGTENVFYNQVLDFNDNTYWSSFKVVYNASSEFLRSFEGPGASDPILDHSLGRLKLTVLNPLKVTSSLVPDSVSVRTFLHLENVRVYEAKLTNYIQLSPNYENPWIEAIAQSEVAVIVAQMEMPNVAENSIDPILEQGAPTTKEESDIVSSRPYSLEIGRKFEYTISNLIEVMRRHYELNNRLLISQSFYVNKDFTEIAGKVYKLDVRPHHKYADLYAAWSGHIKYRFIIDTNKPVKYAYIMNREQLDDTGLEVTTLVRPYNVVNTIYGPANPKLWSDSNGCFSTGNIPIEVAYPTSTNQAMIDLSIPYNSHFNYLPTRKGDVFGTNLSTSTNNFNNGYIAIISEDLNLTMKIFEAVGDDFRFHLWRPIYGARFKPFIGSTSTINNYDIGDNVHYTI